MGKCETVEANSADWCYIGWTGIGRYREYVAEFERACSEVGRDPASVRRAWYGGCVCGRTEADVKRLNTNNFSAESSFVDTSAQLIEQMGQFVDAGVDYFMLRTGGFPDVTTRSC